MKFFIAITIMLLSVIIAEDSSAHATSQEVKAEKEQIKSMSEDEILQSYFTNHNPLSLQIYASAIYDEKDFENRFGNPEKLSDTEKEEMHKAILNEIQESEVSICHYVTKGLGVLFNSTHKLLCKDVKDVSSSIKNIQEYKGVSCHCSYEISPGEVFYIKKYPPPTDECLRFASSTSEKFKCSYESPLEPFSRQFTRNKKNKKSLLNFLFAPRIP